MTGLNRRMAHHVVTRSHTTAEARELLDMLGLIDGLDGRELVPDVEWTGRTRPDVHDVVLAEHSGPRSTAPAGLTARRVPAPAHTPAPRRSSAPTSRRATVPRTPKPEQPPAEEPDRAVQARPTLQPSAQRADAPAGPIGSPERLLEDTRAHFDGAVRRASARTLIAWLELRIAHEDLADVRPRMGV